MKPTKIIAGWWKTKPNKQTKKMQQINVKDTQDFESL